jgi:tetratricopeptide (TPR) repeat protein
MLHLDRGEPELALRRLGAAEELVAEQRLGFIVEPHFLRGAALTAQGAFADAVASLREGLAGRLGTLRDRPYGLARLSEALARQGEHEAALAAAREGLEVREKTGGRQWEPELQRLAGIALSGLNRLEDAERAFQEALRVARTQQAKAYELRAAMSLARLWGERGRRTDAREVLAPVYTWFTEGFDTVDLKEAKKLLDELTLDLDHDPPSPRPRNFYAASLARWEPVIQGAWAKRRRTRNPSLGRAPPFEGRAPQNSARLRATAAGHLRASRRLDAWPRPISAVFHHRARALANQGLRGAALSKPEHGRVGRTPHDL